jgi:hypothetical protein
VCLIQYCISYNPMPRIRSAGSGFKVMLLNQYYLAKNRAKVNGTEGSFQDRCINGVNRL